MSQDTIRLTVQETGERLDRFIADSLPKVSRSKVVKLIEEGLVSISGAEVKASLKLVAGMVVEVILVETPPVALTPADMPIDVVYEDADVLVVNKARGIATHPAPTLREPTLVEGLLARSYQLSSRGEAFRPGIVHRLDKDTTGLLMIAKNDQAHASLAKQIETKTAERRYLAVVAGWHEEERFVIDAPIGRDPRNRQRMAVVAGGRFAQTHVVRLAKITQGLLLACRLTTGRTHQIRVHLSSMGLPVLGDVLYAPPSSRSGPLQLHAAFLSFAQPTSGNLVACSAIPPDDFIGHEMIANIDLGSMF